MLGERIKQQRKKCGLSQEKVAELVGVSRQAVTKWETGQSAPSTENLFKLAEIFGTTVDLLLNSGENAAGKSGRLKKNALTALIVLGGYVAIYLLGRIIWCDFSQSSVIGWLISAKSNGKHSYLYGWLLSSGLFWAALIISVLPSLWGNYKFSFVSFAGFVLGIILGMLLGPNPAGAALGQSHYGWAIWGAVYLVSLIAGIIAERKFKNRPA